MNRKIPQIRTIEVQILTTLNFQTYYNNLYLDGFRYFFIVQNHPNELFHTVYLRVDILRAEN